MPMVTADWSIARATGDIRYIGADHGGGSPSYATVIEFHRWLQAFADDASSVGDDEHDITDPTSSARATDTFVTLLGVFNVDANATEHLYAGSIVQGSGGTEAIFDGVVNYGNSAVQIQLIQDGAVIADDWWNFAGGGLNADAAQNISHQFMILTRTAGADVDGRRLIGTSRTFGNTYKEFSINGTARGVNVLALDDAADLNNQTIVGTVAGWTGITLVTEGYVGLDVDNTGGDEFYYSEWNTNQPTRTINEFYERMKWLTRDGSAETLYGLNGELFRGITHEIDVDGPTGTFNAFEAVSWAGGTGQMLAIDSTTAATKMWIQLLTGVIPSDNDVITGGTSSATVTMNVTITSRTLSLPFIGASTGSAIIGGYGVGIEVLDLTKDDKLFDLTSTQRVPPNNVTFTVSGLVVGEDRLFVTNDNAGDVDYAQFTLNGALTSGTVTAVIINGAIPLDTPSSGTIRIERDSGLYSRHAYSAWTGSTFTISSTDFSVDGAANANNTLISYLDLLATAASESFVGVYVADRTYFIRDRDGGGTPIKTFETTGVGGTNGGGVTVIRTTDA